MGAAPSKTTQILNETPIQFDAHVVDQLANSPATPPERQSTLDAHIRARIQSELERLRKEEANIKLQIEQALEKENLERERAMDSSVNSAGLLGDLEEIQSKIDRFKSKKDFPDVKLDQEALIACYRSHPKTTLDCWQEVQNFKVSVAKVEQEYLKSLQ